MRLDESSQQLPIKLVYRWELLFDFTNNENVTQKFSQEYEVREVVDVARFEESIASTVRATKFEVSHVETQKSGDHRYTFEDHVHCLNQLRQQLTSRQRYEYSMKRNYSCDVQANQSVRAYQLVLSGPGIEKRGAISNTNGAVEDVECVVVVHRSVGPDLQTLINKLATICPKRDNCGEWQNIRSLCATLNVSNVVDSVPCLLQRFATTTPGQHNRSEWSQIRDVCNRLLKQLETGSHVVDAFYGFVNLLSGIRPAKFNCGEWEQIRDVCEQIKSSA